MPFSSPEYRAKWRAANREKLRAYDREYQKRRRRDTKEKAASDRRYYLSNREDRLAYQREYSKRKRPQPTGLLALLQQFMTKPIIHPPRPQEPAYAQVISRSGNSRMEAQAQRAGQRQATRA